MSMSPSLSSIGSQESLKELHSKYILLIGLLNGFYVIVNLIPSMKLYVCVFLCILSKLIASRKVPFKVYYPFSVFQFLSQLVSKTRTLYSVKPRGSSIIRITIIVFLV